MTYALWIVQGLLSAFVAYGRWRLGPPSGGEGKGRQAA